jgi:DnaJ like chaperone protein
MFIGKLIGGLLGYSLGGVVLGLLGLFVGHLFDKGYAQARFGPSPEQRRQIQDRFFTTVFTLLGHLAKADGRISEAEIRQTEQFMAQMGLTAEHRREAIRLFKLGAEPGFDPDRALREFMAECGRYHDLEQVLRRVARALGMSSMAFEQMLRMLRAQDTFRGAPAAGVDRLESAYQALGVNAHAGNGEIKRAYRRLMSEYHPDKLIGQGVPDDMVKQATERSQEIQAAYDVIKKARGL